MGEVLLKYYKYVGDEKGLVGKIELAQKTKIPSIKAGTEPDSKQNIEIFRKSILEITGKKSISDIPVLS